jgi:hypothetical protein
MEPSAVRIGYREVLVAKELGDLYWEKWGYYTELATETKNAPPPSSIFIPRSEPPTPPQKRWFQVESSIPLATYEKNLKAALDNEDAALERAKRDEMLFDFGVMLLSFATAPGWIVRAYSVADFLYNYAADDYTGNAGALAAEKSAEEGVKASAKFMIEKLYKRTMDAKFGPWIDVASSVTVKIGSAALKTPEKLPPIRRQFAAIRAFKLLNDPKFAQMDAAIQEARENLRMQQIQRNTW